jgi:cytidylate kinase
LLLAPVRHERRPERNIDLALQREECEYTRYLHYYRIDIRDLSHYDLVLNSEHWNPEALGAIVDVAIVALKKT